METFTKEEFNGKELRFADITEQFCSRFKYYMQHAPSKRSPSTTLSQNSASSFFNKFKAALREAHREGYLVKDINATISSIPPAETNREYLSPKELAVLTTVPCRDTILKKAAFFSALTGLRFSDIQKLTWGEVRYIEDKGYYIVFRQQKTNGQETLPIPDTAYQLLEASRKSLDRPSNNFERVFKGLQYSAYQNKHLVQWTKDAGIHKHITFHSFRHTFAIHKLLEGTDIYTVSKLLGHRDLKTTQIYAKIVDSMKREAMDKTSITLDMRDFES